MASFRSMLESEGQQPAAPASTSGDVVDAEDIQEADWRLIEEPQPSPDLNLDLRRSLATAERQLAEARLQISELEALLEDLPEIFERKFSQRLQPVLERQEQLLADNRTLHQQIQRLAPAPGEVRLRFNPEAAADATAGIQLPQLPQPGQGQRRGWGNRSGRQRRAA
jgi:hypothetical protein